MHITYKYTSETKYKRNKTKKRYNAIIQFIIRNSGDAGKWRSNQYCKTCETHEMFAQDACSLIV